MTDEHGDMTDEQDVGELDSVGWCDASKLAAESWTKVQHSRTLARGDGP